jgi:hypothetical protein
MRGKAFGCILRDGHKCPQTVGRCCPRNSQHRGSAQSPLRGGDCNWTVHRGGYRPSFGSAVRAIGAVEAVELSEPFLKRSGQSTKDSSCWILQSEAKFGSSRATELAQMPERRRIDHTDALEEQLASEANRLREEAKKFSPGAEREQLLRRARQAETGSQMSEWLHSPGLQPPSSCLTTSWTHTR